MDKIRVVFFGTHNFATVILQGLIDSPLIDVGLVITQPDKPVGRKKILTPPPVKVLAEKHDIKVEQPKSLKKYELEPGTFDLGVTAQYGLLIPKHVFEAPTYDTLNVHTSLLPKYRGASPIQYALIWGEKETGVTIMKIGVGMDTGPIILQEKIDIGPDEMYQKLDARLAKLGSKALLEAIPRYVSGELKPQEQPGPEFGSTCDKLTRESGFVDWMVKNYRLYNMYRGMTPWPGIWTTWEGKRLKLLNIKPIDGEYTSGKVLVEDGKIFVGCGRSGRVEITELQLEGKKPMDAKTFLQGHGDIDGATLPN